MRAIKCNLLKPALLLISFLGTIISGVAQNTAPVNEGNAVVYNQSGIGTSIVIVFAALVIILLLFKYFGKLMAGGDKKPVTATVPLQVPAAPQVQNQGEINAAIAMALYLYSNELHDQENPVITMIRVSKTYSPWSSKIYGLRKLPR